MPRFAPVESILRGACLVVEAIKVAKEGPVGGHVGPFIHTQRPLDVHHPLLVLPRCHVLLSYISLHHGVSGEEMSDEVNVPNGLRSGGLLPLLLDVGFDNHCVFLQFSQPCRLPYRENIRSTCAGETARDPPMAFQHPPQVNPSDLCLHEPPCKQPEACGLIPCDQGLHARLQLVGERPHGPGGGLIQAVYIDKGQVEGFGRCYAHFETKEISG
mmetsp:Transcript_44344/g.87570  ORF Transcript_44344/g.87570 Transcript_44344/m.87570 type:complete len:214 (+) Transcript_44344:801-1442(+)